MPARNYLAKKRLDKYYKLAKDEGFKSRAAFKLLQINREFNFLGQCQCVLDLCAAPGGWTQVCTKSMPLSSLIVAVDIAKMSNIGGCRTIQGDIFTKKCKFDIKKTLNNMKCDAVLHDGAPNVTGTWSKDAYAQCELTLQSLKIATDFLKHGGIFVTKVFRSNDYNSLLWVIKQFFENVIAYKPMASRNTSAETYLICKNYLAPKKIDKRLFDPQFIFREIEEKKESISVMKLRKKKKLKKNRQGYDIDGGIVHTSTNIIDFLESSKPETILGEYNAFDFDETNETNKLLLNHEITDNEIKILFSDLTLLGKSDFRKLLKWRKKMIKYLTPLNQISSSNNNNNNNENSTNNIPKTSEELELEENEKIRLEIQDMYDNKKKEQKKKQRKIRQAKIKRARTMLMGGIKDDDVWDFSHEQIGLYKLDDFETTEGLTEFIKTNVEVKNVNPKQKVKKITQFVEQFNDSDSELEMTSKRLDDLYNSYKKRRNIKTKEDKKLEKKKLEKDAILSSDDEFSSLNSDSDNEMDLNPSNNDIINDNNEIKDNEMIVKPDEYIIKPEPKALIAKRWFGDDMFDNIEKNVTNNSLINEMKEFLSSENENENENDTEMKIVKNDKNISSKKHNISKIDEKKDEKFKASDLPDVLRLPYKLQRKMKKMNRDHRRRLKREENKRIERDCLFKEVPIVNVDNSIHNDDMSTDSEGIAETLAIGEKMFKKKDRTEIIDGSYNRFCWNDNNDDLPKWFIDDENANYRVNLPVTKEEVREYKEKLKAANARPIKKVAEAKARKKLRAQRAWNRIKRQATKIADNEDLSEKSKIKQIQKLYKKMDRKDKIGKVYMVSKGRKGSQGMRRAHGSKKIKLPKNALKVRVDKRMKADKLAVKHREKRIKKGKKMRPKRTMNRHNLRKKSRK